MNNSVLINHQRSMSSENTGSVCDVCGQTGITHLASACDRDTDGKPFRLAICAHCSTVRTLPELTDTELGQWYRDAYYGAGSTKFRGLIEYWTRFRNARQARMILRHRDTARPHPSVLDIGCGRGHLLSAFRSLGCHCTGIERRDFPLSSLPGGIRLLRGNLERMNMTCERFDIVVLWHVLEHLAAPIATLRRVTELLTPGGTLVIAVPNYGGYQSSLFRRHWFHLDLPRHRFHFTPETLNTVLHRAGFAADKFHTWSFDQSVFGFVQSALNSSGLFPINSLYKALQSGSSGTLRCNFILQCLLAGLLLPFAILEYFYSATAGRGSCVILTARFTGKYEAE